MGFKLSVKFLDEYDLSEDFDGPIYEDTWDDEEIVELTDLKILDIRLDKAVAAEPEVDPDDPNATYTVQYLDSDDSEIESFTDLHYGDNTPTVDGSSLTLEDHTVTQPFKEWSPAPTATVEGNATYKATYHDYPSSIGITYTGVAGTNESVNSSGSNARIWIASGEEYDKSYYENGAIPLSDVSLTFDRDDLSSIMQSFSAGTVLAVNPATGERITKTNSTIAFCSLVYGVFNVSTGAPNESINSVLRYQGVYAISLTQGGDSLSVDSGGNLFGKGVITRNFVKKVLGQRYYITFAVWDMFSDGNPLIENPRDLKDDYVYIGNINKEAVLSNDDLGGMLFVNNIYHDNITINASWNRPIDSQQLTASYKTNFRQVQDE